MKTVSLIVPCKFNANKQWIISRIGNAQYSLNQLISGKLFYPQHTKASIRHISDAVNISQKSIINMFR